MGMYDFLLGDRAQTDLPPMSQGRGQYGLMAEGISRALARRNNNVQNKVNGESVMREAVRRFESIGTDEAMQVAQTLRDNPQGAAYMAEQSGGWAQMEQAMQGRAQMAQAGQVLADIPGGAGGQGLTGMALVRHLVENGTPFDLAMQIAMQESKLRGKPAQLELKKIYDPNSPTGFRYASEEKALGQAAPGSGESISMNAKTGEFRIDRGGRTGFASGELGKKAQAKAQETAMGIQDSLVRLDEIAGSFDRELLELPTKARVAIAQGMDYLGIASEDQLKQITVASVFEQNVLDDLIRHIKFITGAQMSEKEADRIEKSRLSLNMSPHTFLTKLKHIRRKAKEANRRYMYMVATGKIQSGFSRERDGPLPMAEGEFKAIRKMRLDSVADTLLSANPGKSKDEIKQLALIQVNQELDSGDVGGWFKGFGDE